jgi:heme exporter protein D
MSLEQFFSMGGYAFYVWMSYGIAALVLIANLITTYRRKAEVRESIVRSLKLEAAREGRAKP